ncbi:MAG TPA: ABC transporter ATP-binding protein [Candidatus Fusicatenibacter merdavium]|uniref:ABC transporter ATP-binding protein n=1 Tax=Candidatus Fusicatenibacter merdavium TaxID=2838600 RepID=A0A9D1XDZ4_9FIRM|nr:ABC transporter ATP-binding protein [Candidatus Fusicatenibacter merdavium]
MTDKNRKTGDFAVQTAGIPEVDKKEPVVQIRHVSKYFGKRKVVSDLTMTTYAGEVFGFLGPNGAGKTTTIKMLVGLIGIDEGRIAVCGQDVTRNFEKAMANVGAIVENPEMYKYMTGMQNLMQYARMRKGVTKERIRQVVELVGLSKRIHEKVGKYSLGMRQRLGVAQALLHNPKVLILDEPTNGLDPAGIRNLRDILKNLAHQEGICVLVSSHLMSEMQLMCDRVGILVNGTLIQVTSVEEMVESMQQKAPRYRYHVQDAGKAAALLEQEEQCTVEATDPQHLEIRLQGEDPQNHLGEINRKLMQAGVILFTVAPVESQRLEDAFIELTKGDTQIV